MVLHRPIETTRLNGHVESLIGTCPVCALERSHPGLGQHGRSCLATVCNKLSAHCAKQPRDISCVRYRNGALLIRDQEVAALSRSAASLVMVCLLPLVAVPAGACWLAGCLDRGIEMRSHFAVKIRHA